MICNLSFQCSLEKMDLLGPARNYTIFDRLGHPSNHISFTCKRPVWSSFFALESKCRWGSSSGYSCDWVSKADGYPWEAQSGSGIFQETWLNFTIKVTYARLVNHSPEQSSALSSENPKRKIVHDIHFQMQVVTSNQNTFWENSLSQDISLTNLPP